jgi:hypothetical protein
MINNQAQYGSMDYTIYKCAVKQWQDGKDPYNMQQLNEECTKFDGPFPWRYPALTLPFFSLFVWMPRHIAYSIFIIIGLLILWRSDKKLQLGFIFILIYGFFNAALRNYSVGNMGCIDFVFMAILTYFVLKEKYYWAAITIGVMALFKTVPLAYAAIFIILCPKMVDKVKYLVISFFSFVLIHMISFALFTKLSMSFYKLVFTGYPVIDAGGFYNPSLFALIRDLIWNNIGSIVAYLVIVSIIGLFHLWSMSKIQAKDKQYFLTILAIMCVLPELKMYTYIIAIIPIYFLLKDRLYIDRFWFLLFCGAAPVAINYMYLLNKAAFSGTAMEFFFNYYIYIALLVTYILLSLSEVKKKWMI